MNNFTRSSGKAYWHSITNLTCCFSKLIGNLKLSAMGSMLVMLFLFNVSSVNAQSDQRSTDLNLCYDQIPEALSVESVAALFADACQGLEAEVTLSELVSGDDCSWTAQYTYDISCGDFEDQLKIVYTGGDQSAPELEDDLPQDASGINDCISAAPEGPSEEAIAGLYSDNCGNVNVTKSGEPTGDDCNWSVTYTYTIVDDCGNYADNVVVTYSGGDQSPPELAKNAELPTGESGVNACLADRPEGPSEEDIAALFVDNCGNINVTKSEHFKGDDCGWKGMIIFSVEDDCGNAIDDIILDYTGGDQEDPVLNDTPGDFTVTCIDVIPSAQSITFTDNCTDGKNKAEASDDTSNLGIACEGGTVIRTWTATDDCGNSTSHSITITVLPADPAEFETPEPYSIDCGDLATFEPQYLAYSNGGQGACDISGEVQGVAEAFEGSCGEFQVNYSFTDECGREITASQTVTVEDNTPPVIDPGAKDITVECDGEGNMQQYQDWLDANGEAIATDNCGNVTWTYEVVVEEEGCGATMHYEVTFTASDDCGNSASTKGIFIIEDTTDPSIDTEASDETVECDGAGNADALAAWLANNGGAEASDMCSDVTWSNNFDGLSDDCGETGSATVEFTATDDCGNSSKTTATFTIEDTTDPSIDTEASNETVECDGEGNGEALEAWLASNGGATASDICSDVVWSNNFDGLSDDCGATGSATVEFTATDDCGNSSKTTATFTIEDTNSPPITNEAQDETVECDGEGNADQLAAWLANNGGAVASDICSDVVWSNDYGQLSDECGATGSVYVTFTVTDDCGLSSSTAATFTIEDTTDPSIDSEAEDMTVECKELNDDNRSSDPSIEDWLNNNGGASASDACGDVTWSNDFSGLSDDCGNTGSATVTFTATDDCGNMSTTTATYTIEDTTDPTIDVEASDETVECDGAGNTVQLEAWLNNNGGASASDICGNVTWSNNFEALSDDCGATGSATVEFTATDDCGNSSKTTATFTIEDTTDPSIDTEASDMTVECDGEGNAAELAAWLANNGGAAASDLCGDVTWSNNCGNGSGGNAENGFGIECIINGDTFGTMTYTPNGTDENGNTVYAGVFSVGPTTGYALGFNVETNRWEGGALNGDVVWYSDTLSCNVNDWTDTDVSVCEAINVICEGGESSVCELSDECGATGSVTVEFTATDSCGNTSKTTATFTVEDTVDPTIDAGAKDLTVECDGEGNVQDLEDWLNNNAEAIASDDCSDVTWSHNFEALSDDCGATGSATVEFTATDECGNSSKTTATFTIEDTTNPSIDAEAEDMTVECDGEGNADKLEEWLANNGGASASDLCSDVVWSNNFTALSDDCGATGSATVEFTATDDCGNESKTTATFTIEDTTNPSIDNAAEDMTVECDGAGNAAELAAWLADNGGAEASDLCGDVTWSNDYSELSDDCGATGSATVVFTAADACGNTSKTEATFTIEDTTNPTIDTEAGDMTVECDGEGNQADLEAWLANNGGAAASDLCGDVTWSYSCGSGNGGITFLCNFSNNDRTVVFEAPIGTNNGYDVFAPGMVVDFPATPVALTYNEDAAQWQMDTGGTVLWTSNDTSFSPPCEVSAWAQHPDLPDACTIYDIECGEGNGSSVCELSDECGATGSVTVDFTATDSCGNTSKTTATFTVEDTTDPTIDADAKDLTVECDGEGNVEALEAWLENNAEALASDTCGDVTWSNNFEALSDDCGATGSATVEFTATDSCGNTSKTSATFTIEDTTDPSIDVEASDMTVECSTGSAPMCMYSIQLFDSFQDGWQGDLLDVVVDGVVILDDITLADLYNGEEPIPGENDPIPFPVTSGDAVITIYQVGQFSGEASWVVYDSFGEIAGEGDGSTPIDIVANCPGEETPSSDDAFAAWLANNGGAEASDLCGDVTWSNNSQGLSDDCGATGTETVEFTATDSCGNTSKTTATFTIEDTTPPSIDADAEDMTVECDGAGNAADLEAWLSNNGGASASDLCSDVTWSNDYTALSDDCGATGSATVEFTATDDCGNESKTTATFTIEDTTNPTIDTDAMDMEVECNGAGNQEELAAWLANNGGATASDTCSGVVWSNDYTALSDDCGATGSATVTFTATDDCGNASTSSATFTIVDTVDPNVTDAMDMTVECDGEGNAEQLAAWFANNGGATASDDCSDVTWSYICGDGTTGGTTSGSASATGDGFVIPDNDPAGASSTAALSGVPEGAMLDDSNVEISITHTWGGDLNITLTSPTGESIDLISENETNGNVDLTNTTITFSDNGTGFADSDLDAECEGEDNSCSVIPNDGSYTFADLLADLATNGSDPNGDWVLSISDNANLDTGELLSWSIMVDYTVEVEGEQGDCSLSDECGATGSVTATFIATDDCGNSTSTTATFTVEDTLPPTIDAGAKDLTVECDGEGNQADLAAWLEINAEALASDACSDVTWSNDFTMLSDDCGETGSALVTFTATDDCGNSVDTQATFTIEDTTDPTIDAEAEDMTVECGAGQADMCMYSIQLFDSFSDGWQGDLLDVVVDGVVVLDDITLADLYNGEDPIPGENDPIPFPVTSGDAVITIYQVGQFSGEASWVVYDSNGDVAGEGDGNTPIDIIADCSSATNEEALATWLADNGGAEASDLCGDVSWSNDFVELSDDCGATGSATVTFTATDSCGNTSTTSATFTIEDTTDPTIDAEASDATVECDGAGNMAELEAWLASNGGAEASDLCGDVTWSNDFMELSDDCGATGSATVEFTATDECGNTSKTSATFTIEDTIAPVLEGTVPPSESDINACFDSMPVPPTEEEIAALFSDQCSDIVVSLFTSPVGDDCGWSVIHIYTVSDECGNPYGDVKVYYSGSDQGKPSIEGVPENVTVECDAVPVPAEVTVTDNCDDDIHAEYLEVREDGDCPNNYTLTRTWTATDDCGNSTTETQVITVQDTTAPVLEGELPTGENQIDMCQPSEDEDFGPSAEDVAALYSDNCGEVVVTKVINNNGDDCKWIIDIEYTVTDDCGNQADQFKIWFHGGDFSAPVLAVECENEVMPPLYTSDGADCPADAGFSLIVGDVISATDDWSVAGIYVSEMENSLEPCFSDNCSAKEDLTFEVMEINDSAEGCPKEMSITFDVIDLCGNRYEGFVCTFIVIDDELPVLTCPEGGDLGVNPETDADGIPFGLVDKVPYTDNCDGAGMTFDYTDDLSSVASGGGEPGSVSATGAGFVIPDNDPVGASSAATVNGIPMGATLEDSDVEISITHTWGGDLQMTLTSPTGESIDLVSSSETNGNVDLTNTTITFSDTGAGFGDSDLDALCEGTDNSCSVMPNDGSYTFADLLADLATNGSDPNGDWVLNVSDNANLDIGEIISWSIDIDYASAPDSTDYTLDRTFTYTDACGNTGECTTTYTWTEAEDPCANDTEAPVVDCHGEVIDLGYVAELSWPPFNPEWTGYLGEFAATTVSDADGNFSFDKSVDGLGDKFVFTSGSLNYDVTSINGGLIEATLTFVNYGGVDDCGNTTADEDRCALVTFTFITDHTPTLSPDVACTYTVYPDGSTDTQACDDPQLENDQAGKSSIELDFKAYPVPFDREVTISFDFDFDTDVTINVHDTRGLLVKSEIMNNVRANARKSTKLDLSRGGDQIFYVTVTTNRGSVTKKIVSSGMKR